jgi:hypothetical protein
MQALLRDVLTCVSLWPWPWKTKRSRTDWGHCGQGQGQSIAGEEYATVPPDCRLRATESILSTGGWGQTIAGF